MNEDPAEIVELNGLELADADDSREHLLDLLSRLEKAEDAQRAIRPLLRLLERSPGFDFGMPGPAVHFLERFFRRGYEAELLESIRRCATPHTVWMLHRVANGVVGAERDAYLSELARVRDANLGEASDAARELLED